MAGRLISNQEVAGSIPVIRSQSQGCASPAAPPSGGSSAQSFVVMARSPSAANGFSPHDVVTACRVLSPVAAV